MPKIEMFKTRLPLFRFETPETVRATLQAWLVLGQLTAWAAAAAVGQLRTAVSRCGLCLSRV